MRLEVLFCIDAQTRILVRHLQRTALVERRGRVPRARWSDEELARVRTLITSPAGPSR